ncbi:MAG: SDR family oxidoreductase [Chloroflexi bacterium]|nr:SDR family oxidoreductase [Chloroflexota bacterium]
MKRIFITGASRGIGLELTRQCLQRGDQVLASCRQPDSADGLQQLKSAYPDLLTILVLDVTDQVEVEDVAEQAAAEVDGLDILFNNAGILQSGEQVGNLNVDNLLNALYTNAVAPVMVAQSLLNLLKAGVNAKIINITSLSGSITRKTTGGHYSYGGSKTALNMFTRTLAFDVVADGIIVVGIAPGWVRTDMGGPRAKLSVEESVRRVLQLTESLSKKDIGGFLILDGTELPW